MSTSSTDPKPITYEQWLLVKPLFERIAASEDKEEAASSGSPADPLAPADEHD